MITHPTIRHCVLAAAIAAVAALAGCKDSPAPPAAGGSSQAAAPAAAAASSKPTLEAIAAEAQGFSVGPPMSARVAYVFFDPQCPHCAELWRAARPLKTQARLVWIPVSLLNASSTTQGAALLAAKDPVVSMDGHEASMAAKRGGIVAEGNVDAQVAAVKKNTDLFNRYGFASVPTIVTKHPQTGEVYTREGSLPTELLAQLLGV